MTASVFAVTKARQQLLGGKPTLKKINVLLLANGIYTRTLGVHGPGSVGGTATAYGPGIESR